MTTWLELLNHQSLFGSLQVSKQQTREGQQQYKIIGNFQIQVGAAWLK